MAGHGGARTRSGPMPDPTSERSDLRGLGADIVPLSSKGYHYKPKAFPLSEWVVFDVWKDEDGIHKERNEAATDAWNSRERALWRDLWKLPQAIAWHMPKYRYLFNTVALYCRQFVLCETADAKAADRATLARYADTIGLTPQGLRLNGWTIVDDEEKQPKQAASSSGKVIPFKSAKTRYLEEHGD